jgi:hypothetical protein
MLELEWPSCSRRHMNTNFPWQAAAVPPITVSHKRPHRQRNYIQKEDEKDILRQTGGTESHTCSSSSSSICFTGNSSIIAPAREGGRLGLCPSATKNKKQVHVVIITTSGNRYRSREDARKKKLPQRKKKKTLTEEEKEGDKTTTKKKRTADSVRNEDAKETKRKEDESKQKKKEK